MIVIILWSFNNTVSTANVIQHLIIYEDDHELAHKDCKKKKVVGIAHKLANIKTV
jgi:hypothetical protein